MCIRDRSNTTLGKIYVAGSGYSNPPVFVSIDNGQSFTSISSGIPSTMVYEIAVTTNDEFIFAATDAGPYVYITENNQWYDLGQNTAPNQVYWTVDYDPTTETVRYGTYGREIWDFKITDGLVSIKNELTTNISVYPNPATDFITIDGYRGFVRIYNMYGQKVIETELNHIDISDLSSGTYFLEANKDIFKFVKQ